MDISKIKVAFLGVSHWHVPLYLSAVEQDGMQVAAVSDANEEFARHFARRLHCPYYTDYEILMDECKPDFVFAFDRHCDMPRLARAILERGIPFSIEKPLGLCTADVEGIYQLVQEKGIFCSIPLIWRYSEIVRRLRRCLQDEEPLHFAFQFIAGPPSRYLKSSGWMLERGLAGSGCMTNLGVHFIDLALLLSGSERAEVLSSVFQYGAPCDVETYASALMRLSCGASFALETGYQYPMDAESKRDNRWVIVTKRGYYIMGVGCFEFRQNGKAPVRISMDTDSDSYYRIYAVDSLLEYMSGKKPTAGLPELIRVRRVLDDIIVKAQ